MAEQRVVLEHETHVALLHGQPQRVLAVEQHATEGRNVEAGEDPEQRRLAGAGGPEQRHELTGLDFERNPVQRRRRAERPHDIFYRYVHRPVPMRCGALAAPSRAGVLHLI